MKLRFDPWDVGWRIGEAHEPRGGELWVPWDRTASVIGPQGSGKTPRPTDPSTPRCPRRRARDAHQGRGPAP